MTRFQRMRLLIAVTCAAILSGCMTVVTNNLGHEAMARCRAVERVKVVGGDWWTSPSFDATCYRHADR